AAKGIYGHQRRNDVARKSKTEGSSLVDLPGHADARLEHRSVAVPHSAMTGIGEDPSAVECQRRIAHRQDVCRELGWSRLHGRVGDGEVEISGEAIARIARGGLILITQAEIEGQGAVELEVVLDVSSVEVENGRLSWDVLRLRVAAEGAEQKCRPLVAAKL